ncbi:MAG TPA: hypothetical protein VIJ79_02370 [Acidobacteriaceae bacterium]
MTSHGFDITVSNEVVDVHRDPKPAPKQKFWGAIVVITTILTVLCALIFLPGKHGSPAMWRDLSRAPINSSDFLFPFCLIGTFVILMGWLAIRWILAAWPADDALHCDRVNFTVSKAKWLDTKGTLVAHSFAISQISQLRYGAIASAKNSTIYGLRFRVDGKMQKLLAGLEAPEAGTILAALKSLGADVLDDPKLQKRIKSSLEMRGDTSWMDRSWMDPKKQ